MAVTIALTRKARLSGNIRELARHRLKRFITLLFESGLTRHCYRYGFFAGLRALARCTT